jgi:hypothetical protein
LVSDIKGGAQTVFQENAVIGSQRKLLNEELYNLYSSPSIIACRMTEAGNVRWARDVRQIRRSGVNVGYL